MPGNKRITAFAMLVIAAAIMILVPKSDGKITTKKNEPAAVSTAASTTTTSPQEVLQSDTAQTSTVTTKNKDTSTTSTATATVSSTAVSTVTTVTTVTTAPVTSTKKPVTTTTTATVPKKTETTTKKVENNKPSTGNTPVSKHGQLSVKGANIVDKNGQVFQLRGMSTHGVGWFPDAVTKENFRVLRDDWGCNAVRLAMYIEESWGGGESCYLADKDRNYKIVTDGIDYAIDLGIYVIVDWHVLNPGDPSTHTKDAKEFFAKIAKEYGDSPNIIFELCNEPNGGVNWSGTIKPYCEEVTKEIRKYDSDAIIVCGTATWSQDIHDVVGNTLSDKNTVYALHFYANTHTDWLRERLQNCVSSGLPVLVTEFGTCDASGNGGFNTAESTNWLRLLDELSIGYFNWSLCNKDETASALKTSASLSSLKAGESQLSESGKFIRNYLRKRAGL